MVQTSTRASAHNQLRRRVDPPWCNKRRNKCQGMYVCMYVCARARACVCVCVCMYVCMYVCEMVHIKEPLLLTGKKTP